MQKYRSVYIYRQIFTITCVDVHPPILKSIHTLRLQYSLKYGEKSKCI